MAGIHPLAFADVAAMALSWLIKGLIELIRTRLVVG